MNGTKAVLAIGLIAIGILLSMLDAQEPASPNRPERYLLLLKTGDRIGWTISPEPNGYRVSIYTEDRYAELIQSRDERAAEIRQLNEKLQGDRIISSDEAKSEDPAIQQRVKDKRRLGELTGFDRRTQYYGQVVHVGSDYIAVQDSNPANPRERLIPAWTIASIVRAVNAKK